MASLFQIFEYDIFISYSQKENRQIGYIIEFVENLKLHIKGVLLKCHKIILAFFFLLLALPAFGQNKTSHPKQQKPKNPESNLSLFDTDEPLEVTLRYDITGYLKKSQHDDSFDGDMTIYLNKTDSINKKITIKYRGTSRFKKCDFPPIQINFKKPLSAGAGSGQIKKLKLVTHCEPGSLSDDYVLREFLVYKLFSVLTDTSLRVRLLRVTYIDSKRIRKPIRQYGFFIEPVELLAERTNSFVVKTTSLTQKDIVPPVMDRLAIFNYMISNWDWSVAGQHNVEVIKPVKYDISGLGIAVPFDFDLTGIVNADYAVPPPALGIQNIRERLFFGVCREKQVYRDELKVFLEKKEQFYSVVNEFPYINPRAKKDIISFLDQFFSQLEKQKSLDNLIDLFIKSCKK